ncbi:MAG: hypothetical protein P4L41_18550 [Flavipsychrobacter sp.]|nr:hypothetical protein [Flavipsychrobacter sp.]
MRNLLSIILFVFATNSALHAQISCPVNFFGKDLMLATHDVKGWAGKIIAFNAIIVEIKDGYAGKPYYKVALDTGQIWVASLMKSGYEVPGNPVRILGYFSDVEQDSVAAKYNKTTYQVLAFGVVDLSTKQISMVPDAKLQVQEWIDGKMPKAYK